MKNPLKNIDLDDWISRFTVKFVNPSILTGDIIAIHRLTTLGKKYDLGEYEIWLSKEVKPYKDILLLHEAVENYLRKIGWRYPESHAYALKMEEKYFGKSELYNDIFDD